MNKLLLCICHIFHGFFFSLGSMTAVHCGSTSLTDSGTNGLEEKVGEALQSALGLQHPGYFPVAQNFGITPVSKLHKA